VLLKWGMLEGAKYHLFHLVSFNCPVGQAGSEVAQQAGVPQEWVDHPVGEDNAGFTLSNELMRKTLGFVAEGTSAKVVADLLAHPREVAAGREFVDPPKKDFVPCRVCGSEDMMTVLDLGLQPLANDFRYTEADAEKCERYPLKLMRCRKCNHAQLSVMVERKALFSNYSYRSGTSRTLDEYFGWLQAKIESEVKVPHSEQKKVLELACNDGTQLNHFKKRGWATYGVDPASNLVPYARENGHTVVNELWGASHADKYKDLPKEFDAILAQNVLAHVPNPVDFLRGCAERMGKHTRTYMQTSQCEMFNDGQFDTVYHEHISFFSPRSFQKMAELVGLKIVDWEISPIHGGSCLVTFMKDDKEATGTLPAAIKQEEDRGQLEDAYYLRYRAQAMATRDWLNKMLEEMHAQGHDIVGYGAAAKGMVLLHYMLAQKPKLEFKYVVDDAPLKQNTYCPGTRR
jgi:SAM-dependent methyltransferase